jgi:hypothetical protein
MLFTTAKGIAKDFKLIFARQYLSPKKCLLMVSLNFLLQLANFLYLVLHSNRCAVDPLQRGQMGVKNLDNL